MITAQIGSEIVGSDFGLVTTKDGGTSAITGEEATGLGHDGEVAVVANPRTGLTGGAHAFKLARIGVVKTATFFGLGCPRGH